MVTDLKIYNSFGIVPTTSYTAAGLDLYVPNIKTEEEYNNAFNVFIDFFKIDLNLLNYYINFFEHIFPNKDKFTILNIVHLYIGIDSNTLNNITDEVERLYYFTRHYLIWKDNIPGLQVKVHDHIFMCSGIKVALDPDTCGLHMNKSGRGKNGWSFRACLIDEDYAGFMSLNLGYTKDSDTDNKFYCGDKIVQMMILPIIHKTPVPVSEEEYNKIMKNSKRGSNAFGSSNEIKHNI